MNTYWITYFDLKSDMLTKEYAKNLIVYYLADSGLCHILGTLIKGTSKKDAYEKFASACGIDIYNPDELFVDTIKFEEVTDNWFPDLLEEARYHSMPINPLLVFDVISEFDLA